MKNKTKKPRVKRRISLAGFCLIYVIVIGIILAADFIMRKVNKPESNSQGIIEDGTFYGDSSMVTIEDQKTPEPTEVPDVNKAGMPEEPTEPPKPVVPDGCVTIPLEKKGVSSGCLLRLDSEHGFEGVTGELVTFAEKNDSYRLKHTNLMVKSEVVEAMNKMASAYETVTGRADLMIYSTTEAYGVEGSLYPAYLPDRATGYCIDICILNEDGTISKIASPNAWLQANAYLYGFVFSYTEADVEVTGIAAAPYHLRYVGREHAGIMHAEELTLNQYLEALPKHTAATPFYFIDGGKNWSVYYVPSENGGTEVPVPLNASYDISGDNTNGFIVKAEGLLNG